jgi:hypothetical protein
MWFSPAWSSTGVHIGGHGPGHWGRLFEVGSYTTNASYGWLSLYTDAGGTNLYFAGQSNNGSGGVFLTARIAWPAQSWHHLAITYSPSNSALYVDGLLVTNGLPVSYRPDPSVLTNGFSIGSDATGTAQVHGMIDNVATCAYPLNADTIWQVYNLGLAGFALNPLNPANLISANWEVVIATNSEVIAGSGYLQSLGVVTNCVTNVSVWFTNVLATPTANGRVNLAFTIAGGSPGSQYDVFGTTALASPINSATWAWMGQGASCTRYALTNLPNSTVMLVLGTPLDTDGDGLTDAFEKLVSRTDPDNWDTYGIGIPDGYQFTHFGQAGVDPYYDPLGDGWTLLDAFQNGFDAFVWRQPPAPRGLRVTLDQSTWTATLTWDPDTGPISGYTIARNSSTQSAIYYYNVGRTNQFVDTHYTPYTNILAGAGYLALPDDYSIIAHRPKGDSYQAYGWSWDDPPVAFTIEGPGGSTVLAVKGIPDGATMIRLSKFDFDLSRPYLATNVDLPVTLFSNVFYTLPPSLTKLGQDGSGLVIQAFWPDGSRGLAGGAGSIYLNTSDGRTQLVQNLCFAMRAASPSSPLVLKWNAATIYYPTNYAFASYDAGGLTGSALNDIQGSWDITKPFSDNYLYRNCVWSTDDADATWGLNTGCLPDWILESPLKYSVPTNGSPPQSMLSASQTQWICPFIDPESLGIQTTSSHYYLPMGITNWFGLPLLNVLVMRSWQNSIEYATMTPDSTLNITNGAYYFFPNFAQPTLLTSAYYFKLNTWDALFPDDLRFIAFTNQPLLFAGVGDQITVVGYAKQQIVNGDHSKPAYLGQYFDKAFKANTDGSPSTNETGILSPYGDFLATEPGPVVLTAMPDLSQTNSPPGQCIINVLKLQLDVNHDGGMDLSFDGPDNTTPDHPFVFWVNDDYDRPHKIGSDPAEDDLASNDSDAYDFYAYHTVPDFEYRSASGERIIPSLRDLEDFARLWICGISTNLAVSLPPGTTGELSWGDKGNPDPNNPTIDLFIAADKDGGIGYLTNFPTAFNQTNRLKAGWVGRLGPGDSIPLFDAGFAPRPYLIWCGVSNGSGALTLTITQGGTNLLAQTSVYIKLVNIKQMYERYSVEDEANKVPANYPHLAREGVPAPFEYPATSDTNRSYILLVHDYDLPLWKKDRYAETAFKRLYWQGYQGRFGLFRWPGITNSRNSLDDSEYNAWRSGAGLLNLLTNLNAQYPDEVYLMAHGYGAVVAGEALRQAGTNRVANAYVAMQGAVASETYDPTVPFITVPPGTPTDFYFLYFTNSPNWYFSGAYGADLYVNYFNTNDFILTNLWLSAQASKPVGQYFWIAGSFYKLTSPLAIPTDTYEIFSYCDMARTRAIGAQSNVGGQFWSNAKFNQVDLSSSPYNFGGAPKGHSQQFLDNYAYESDFWRAVLRSMGLKP